MSDLQLGLIVVGILVVAGVYAFNRYQEWQLRRRVESRFAQRPDDVLMQQAHEASARADDARIEPSLGPAAPADAERKPRREIVSAFGAWMGCVFRLIIGDSWLSEATSNEASE